MPYNTTWKESGIIWNFHGHVTAQEIEEANSDFYIDERSDSAKYQIINALDVENVEWNENKIKQMAALDKGATYFIKDLKVAYVSDSHEISKVLEKYIAISKKLNSSWKFKGFDSMESARNWISS